MKSTPPRHNATHRTHREHYTPKSLFHDEKDVENLHRQNRPTNARNGIDEIERVVIGTCAKCGGDATMQSPGGSVYCAECGQCARCHQSVAAFVRDERRGLWLCPCVVRFGETIRQDSLV